MTTRIVNLGLTCLLLCSITGFGQYTAGRTAGVPYFESKAFSTFDEATGNRLTKLFMQIFNSNLTYIKNDSGYVAEVQFDIFVSEVEGDYSFTRTMSKSVFSDTYEPTTAQNVNNTFITALEVKPGKYEVRITAHDRNNNSQYSRKLKFVSGQPDETKPPVMLSDVLFFSDYTTDAEDNISAFQPSLNNLFASDNEFIYAYFNTYCQPQLQNAELIYTVKDENNVVIQRHQYTLKPDVAFVEHYVRLSRYYLDRNGYTLELTAHADDQWVIKNASFGFFWRFSPSTVQDLDLAIRQLRYISKNDSIKYFRDKTFEEKQAYFSRFWARRDPNPSTSRNELMEEYYRRVNFANANFSSTGVGGWLTDRGRIFIKFGEPDEIERHPFEPETFPYQIWRYYAMQKVFLFIDRTGFGDYDLHPSYYYVEYE